MDEEKSSHESPADHGHPGRTTLAAGDSDVSQNLTPSIPKEESVEKSAPAAPHPIAPNGDLHAWLGVVACMLMFTNTWGIVNTFGVYQSFYETGFLSDKSSSTISWIGTIQAFLLVLVGAVTGPLFDMGYLQTLLWVGSTLIVFGLMMLSLSTEYYQIFLTQGVIVGIGCGMSYAPGLALVNVRFPPKQRPLALGIATSGAAIGGIIYPIIFRELQRSIGFAWATRVTGFIAMGLMLISLAIFSTSKKAAGPTRSLWDVAAFKELPFVVVLLGVSASFFGYWVPFFFIPTFARLSVGTSENYAFYLLAVLNAGSVFGRLAPSLLLSVIPAPIQLAISGLACGILCFAWMGVHSVAGVTVFCILYGFFAGVMVSIQTSVLATVTPDMRMFGTRFGMVLGFTAISSLVGSPIASAASNFVARDFTGAQAWCGATMLVGGFGLSYLAFLILRK